MLGLFELLPRENVDPLMVACVFSIESSRFFRGVEKSVTLGGFLVFLEGHHAYRAHGIEPGAHLAVYPVSAARGSPLMIGTVLSAINS